MVDAVRRAQKEVVWVIIAEFNVCFNTKVSLADQL